MKRGTRPAIVAEAPLNPVYVLFANCDMIVGNNAPATVNAINSVIIVLVVNPFLLNMDIITIFQYINTYQTKNIYI